MLQNSSSLIGCSITASDGSIGTVTDLLFDDVTWTVRWLVIDAGTWLTGRDVLLPPFVISHADTQNRTFDVSLTKAQIEASPAANNDMPVSRQHETDLYGHYGWSPYWGSGMMMAGYGGMGAPMMMPLGARDAAPNDIAAIEREEQLQAKRDPNLRSVSEVTGYHIHATDGDIGHLAEVLVEDDNWTLRYLIVNTSNWWMGKKVLITPRIARQIAWVDRAIYLGVDRDKIKSSPTYDPSQTVDRMLEDKIAQHYADAQTVLPLPMQS